MRHLRRREQDDPMRLVLAATETGIESCTIAEIALPEGALLELPEPAERLLLVLRGSARIGTGTDAVDLQGAGYLWSADGAVRIGSNGGATLLEVALPPSSQAPAQRIGSIDPTAFAAHAGHAAGGKAFGSQPIIDRATGGGARIFAAVIEPGSGMSLHIHPFDQFYYLLSGQLTFGIGLAEAKAKAGDLVIFPAGTVHSNRNDGPGPVLEITINAPEPLPGVAGVHNLVVTES